MTLQEYQTHLGRLTEQFGKAAYSQARAELIWREVKDFSPFWWEKTVDKFLLTCRQAPLMTEFADEIGAERERAYKFQKKQHEQDAKDFYEGTYQPEDAKTICQYVVKRMCGQVSDADFANFTKHLKEAADAIAANGVRCKKCEDSGLYLHLDGKGGLDAYRCYCSKGHRRVENYPIWRNQQV